MYFWEAEPTVIQLPAECISASVGRDSIVAFHLFNTVFLLLYCMQGLRQSMMICTLGPKGSVFALGEKARGLRSLESKATAVVCIWGLI